MSNKLVQAGQIEGRILDTLSKMQIEMGRIRGSKHSIIADKLVYDSVSIVTLLSTLENHTTTLSTEIKNLKRLI